MTTRLVVIKLSDYEFLICTAKLSNWNTQYILDTIFWLVIFPLQIQNSYSKLQKFYYNKVLSPLCSFFFFIFFFLGKINIYFIFILDNLRTSYYGFYVRRKYCLILVCWKTNFAYPPLMHENFKSVLPVNLIGTQKPYKINFKENIIKGVHQ